MKEKAYDFIHDVLGDEVGADAEAWVDENYAKPVRTGTVVICVAAVVCVGSVLVAYTGAVPAQVTTIAMYAGIIAAFIGFFKVYRLRNRFPETLSAVMNDQVDPVAYGARYLVFIRQQKIRDVVGASWNYARALRWMGRHDDARKLFEAYGKRHGFDRGPAEILAHVTYAFCDFDLQDTEALKSELETLSNFDKRQFSRMTAEACQQLAIYYDTLVALVDPEHVAEARERIEGWFDSAQPLQKPLFALMLAQSAPNRNERSRWVTVAAKNAGTTWMAAKAHDMKVGR